MTDMKILTRRVTNLEENNVNLHITLEKQAQRIKDLTGQVQELHRRVEQAQLPRLDEQSTEDVETQS